jgi:hypothetical protein
MRHRTTFLFMFLFAAGLAALWWVDHAKVPTREQQQEIVNRLLPELIDAPLDEIQRVVVERRDPKTGGPIEVERRAGGLWQLRQPIDAAAEPNLVETLVRNFKDLRKSTDAGTIVGDPALYGLDRPAATVALYGRAGKKLASIDIGTTAQERIYVRPGGAKGIEVVDARLLGLITQPVKAWRDRALFRVPSFRVESLAIHESSPPRDAEVRRDERRWLMTVPIAAPADGDKAEGLVAELAALRVADGDEGFVQDGAGPQDFARFGLDRPWMTLQVTPFQGRGTPQIVRIGKEVAGKPDQRYAVRDDQDDVVKVDVKTLREAYTGPKSLRSQKVTDFTPGRASRVRIDMPGRVFDLARAGDRWQRLRPLNEPADSATVQSLIAALADLKTSEFLEPGAVSDAKLDPPSFRVRLWQTEPGAAPSSPTASDAEPAAAPRVDLRLGRLDALKKTLRPGRR